MIRRCGRNRNGWALALAVSAWAFLCVFRPLTTAQAQQAGKAEKSAPAPAPAATAPAPSPVGATPATNEAEAKPAESTSVLYWLVETSGWIGAVLLVLSIYFVAKVVQMFMELRLEVAAPAEILQQCENLLKAKDFMGVYKLVKGDDSFFSTVLTAGLAELPQGLAEARDAMERVGETLVVEMEKKISMMAVIGSLGPMIGLLGTLKGMISSFSGIATSGPGLNNASPVARGISESLVLTFEGVFLAVPAIYFFALFRNRVASISTATMLAADEFIRRTNTLLRAKPKEEG
jgi:biopolymer transport protein ExbB